MTKLFVLVILFLITSCSRKEDKIDCNKNILDLDISSDIDKHNLVTNYAKSSNLTIVNDTAQLLRFADSTELSYFFQPSKLTSSQRKYSLKAKEGIIKTPKYQMDVLIRQDNDVNGDAFLIWLKTYDKKRKQISHLDFAAWSPEGHSLAGLISCDTTIYMILNDETRVYKINDNGKINHSHTLLKD